ncbi:unnamed protein product, partial [Larinioides sclopetarius]
HNAPATLVLISGDINYSPLLSDFKNRKGIRVIVVHQIASPYFIDIDDEHFEWNYFTENLPPRRPFVPQIPVEVLVTHLPETFT